MIQTPLSYHPLKNFKFNFYPRLCRSENSSRISKQFL